MFERQTDYVRQIVPKERLAARYVEEVDVAYTLERGLYLIELQLLIRTRRMVLVNPPYLAGQAPRLAPVGHRVGESDGSRWTNESRTSQLIVQYFGNKLS
jgi:hypothetical protein